MERHNWTPAQIDEIDAHYYFDLLDRKNQPKPKKKASKWAGQKVVPIDAVF